MKHKPIKIAWDDLEDAFNSQNEELIYYLDLVTGQVALEGEGEEDEFAEDDAHFEGRPNPAPPPRRQDSTRLYIEPPGDELKVEWMRKFLDGSRPVDPELAAVLREALTSDNPIEEINEILRNNGDERARWFLYRSERLHDLIDRWLKDNAVEVVGSPPW